MKTYSESINIDISKVKDSDLIDYINFHFTGRGVSFSERYSQLPDYLKQSIIEHNGYDLNIEFIEIDNCKQADLVVLVEVHITFNGMTVLTDSITDVMYSIAEDFADGFWRNTKDRPYSICKWDVTNRFIILRI